jgi:hypothetical protein
MANQNLILNRQQSVLLNAGRQQVATPFGDLWVMLPSRVPDVDRFVMATEYNDIEDQVDDTIDSGFLAFETYGDNTIHGISKAPNRPKPPTQ